MYKSMFGIWLVPFLFLQVQAEESNTMKADSAKQNIAVLDLEPRGGLTAEEVLSISDRLRGELINTGKYTVLERGQMDVILKEQGFQQTGVCSEASCIVEVGQLLAVHKMVGGSIGKVGKAYSINLKIIDVQSGKIERQVSDDIQASKEELVSFHIKNVARKMAGLVKEKKPLTTRAVFWVPVGTVVVGGGAALAYLLLNNSDGAQEDSYQEIQLEVPLQ
jgi:TolB-like protein